MASEGHSHKVEDLIREGALIINDGYRAKNSELSDVGIPFARAGNINGGFHFDDADCVPEATLAKVGLKRSRPGDVVFTSKGTVGRFAFVREGTQEFVYSPQLCYWRSGDVSRILPQWLFYWMNGRDFFEQFKGVAGQTDMAEYVSLRDQRSMKITIPRLPEQRRIAHILGSLDDKIELNRRMNDTLEAMARALFQSWFVDFDPVRRNAEGCEPRPEDALFPDSFEDSKIGEVPKGWEVGSILREADLLSGGTPKTDVSDYWNGSIPWASAKDVSQCGEAFLVSTERTITELGVSKSATKIIPALSTVVVARGATTGRLTMFGDSMAMNQTCYALRSKVAATFALYCHARHFIERLVQGAHGSVFETITTSTFEAADVLLAPAEVLLAFDEKVAPLLQKIRANILQSNNLSSLRDALLPKLISGSLSSEFSSNSK